MLISLNWIRDFVELPPDLDPRELGERFTRTTAEVDDVRPVRAGARGLIAARVLEAEPIPGSHHQRHVHLEVGGGKTVETVTAAPVLHRGLGVVYAPPGASVNGNVVRETQAAGRTSVGMIMPGEAIGIAMAVQEAVFLADDVAVGEELRPELFDDWLLEVDNKSITHRPDLWGHYGMAREIAAIVGEPLREYPVARLEEMSDRSRPEVPIEIDDAEASPRYTGIVLEGVPTRPAPLWMQLRLGHVGMRPITGLVDLTNYVMADLGQPMHAFDAAKVNRIEVGWAREGEVFRTLDGIDRTLTGETLTIQCRRQSIALAGVMGGLETEVSEGTKSLLLESANFHPAVIRRTATRLGLRTDASARFEKSLDPNHTVLAIQRFFQLARDMYPQMRAASRLSDGYPRRRKAAAIRVRTKHVARTVGREVSFAEASTLLTPLGFSLDERRGFWDVHVPSYRSTADVTIEDDIIEEVARRIGYERIEPAMPRVAMRRFPVHALREIERTAIAHLTGLHGFCEIQGYVWFDSAWLSKIGFDPGPCVELRNPAAEGMHRMRTTLMPGVLAAVERNRFHFPGFSLLEVGSVFETGAGGDGDREHRHAAFAMARRGKNADAELFERLKGAVETWLWEVLSRGVRFEPVERRGRLWEHPQRTASVLVNGLTLGRISVIDAALRRAMDEHLGSWGIAWAELRLDGLAELAPRVEALGSIPAYPVVDLDFSLLVPKAVRYNAVAERVGRFEHALLKRVHYVGHYEGDAVPADVRSLTFRAVVGDDSRTLVDEDVSAFRGAFEAHIQDCGYAIRTS